MKTKTVYQLDQNGVFIGLETSFESPLEPNVFLIPAGCIEIAPPSFDNTKQYAQWNGMEYKVKDIPSPEVKEELVVEPTVEELEIQRQEELIQAEIRAIAIERLKASGKI